ncbi:MAG: S-formylglutathione hydrolase [Hyphomicrobiales bacterium]|nr:S-formylglutathione hydrolase [Hyphomicrobiales bacterium]
MEILSDNKCFGGRQLVCRHPSKSTSTDMTFGIFLPPQADTGKVPVVFYLSGLTCTHENAMVKSGAQRKAAEKGIAIVFPDTSPRGDDVADDDAYDLGKGAGFYVDATETPWAPHFRMYSYVAEELPELIDTEFPVDGDRRGITGHSMGGHGALTIAMRHPDKFRSLSAFSPIVHPSASDWGRKQFTAYLGADESDWSAHDACALVRNRGFPGKILIDQGDADQFLDFLRPDDFATSSAEAGQDVSLRIQPGYDHSYFFIASFIDDHLEHHAARLAAD